MSKTFARTTASRTRCTHMKPPGVTSGMSLALWRWRQQWALLLLTCLGMIATVIIVCSVPLLAETMQTAGLRDVLQESANNSQIILNVSATGLSSHSIPAIYQQVNPPIQQHLGPYLGSTPRLDAQTPSFQFVTPSPPETTDSMEIYGTSLQAAASHISLVQGRLPQAQHAFNKLEVALTPEAAKLLHLHVGSTIILDWEMYTQPPDQLIISGHEAQSTSLRYTMQVVGLFNVSPVDPFWHGYNFLPDQKSELGVTYTALASNSSLFSTIDQIASQKHGNQVFFAQPSTLSWYYQFDAAHISINQLGLLNRELDAVQALVSANFSNPYMLYQPPYIKKVDIESALFNSSQVPGVLEQFRSSLGVVQIPIALLSAMILCLLLFFIGIMATLLLERQADAIALVRSRGASRWQVLGAFATQSIVLGLLALIIGPPLAIIVVYFLAQHLLPTITRNAVNILSDAPLQALLAVRWYAIAAIVVAIATMIYALFRASRGDIWATRAERSASSKSQRPLWQRLNLDMLAVVIALAGYGISLYLSGVQQLLNAQAQATVITPIALLAPLCLLLAALLLFLRFFPWLLQLGTRLALRRRSAAPMLAVAQMARTPRQSLRMILLLSLATAFTLFTLVFSASQAQRAQDIATYLSGADFSGDLTNLINRSYLLPKEIALYQHVPGVLNATAGYLEDDTSSTNAAGVTVKLIAVDPATYAQATIWTAQDSTLSLSSILAQLAGRRSAAIHSGVLPVYVDAATWSALRLHTGATFPLYRASSLSGTMHYIVIGEVQHIPGITSSSEGGMLVDYQSFATVEQQLNDTLILPNHIWLHTRSDAASLVSVRAAINMPALQLDNLYDRRALTVALQGDASSLNLLALLALGAAAALLLALGGTLLISWLNVRKRLTNFTILRSMGATPKQIAGVLIWEQGIIYTTALPLGVILGALLVFTAVPALVFTGGEASAAIGYVSATQFYDLQHILPSRVILPLSLSIALLVLVIICIAALVFMAQMAVRPTMSAVLRIDENQSSEFLTREEASYISAIPKFRVSTEKGRVLSPSFIRLALWQLRQVRWLLCIQGVGIIAAVTIVCAVPLFSTVTTTAGLRDTLGATPDSSIITLAATTQGLSTSVVKGIQQQIDPYFQQQIGSYLNGQPQLSLQTANLTLLSPAPSGSSAKDSIQLISTSIAQSVPDLLIVQGTLPRETAAHGVIQALLTQQTAQRLHVTVGSLMALHADFFTATQEMFGGPSSKAVLHVQVAGIFTIPASRSAFWHGEQVQPQISRAGTVDTLLIPNDALLASLDAMAAAAHTDTVFSPQTFQLIWRYQLAVSHLNINQLDSLINGLTQLQASIENRYSNIQNDESLSNGVLSSPYLLQINLYNPTAGSFNILNTLNQYQDRIATVSIPVEVLALQILALILLFVGMIVALLVDRQADTIAVVRSRGASNRQVFSALLLQSVGLSVLALIVGPFLAVVAVSSIAPIVVGSPGQQGVLLASGYPLQAALSVGLYAIGTVLVVLFVMIVLLWRAAAPNFLAVRREASRTTHSPLWQRLNLDVIAAIIALVGYGIALYLSGIDSQLDLRTQALVAAPLALIAPLFLLIAVLLLFLRVFPALLQVAARVAARGRGAISMLALAQMARTPRRALRMILLLALAIAFAFFTLVFAASQAQHINNVAAYETGSDFNGVFPLAKQDLSVQRATTLYRSIPGVTSVTVGYTGTGEGATPGVALSLPIQIRAVDSSTFAQTAIWQPQDSPQPLAALMARLSGARSNAFGSNELPVIADTALLNRLNLQVGDNFALSVDNLSYNSLNCVIVGEVKYIPTINDSSVMQSSLPGGMLVDYRTFAAIYKGDVSQQTPGAERVPVNQVWLRTTSDANTLAYIRMMLEAPASPQRLDNLFDRRALINRMNADPLNLSILITLFAGATTALLLALIGNLLTSWFSVRTRLTNFALLRSLGAAPRQVIDVLLWEQGLIYSTALVVGVIFGLVLSITVVPALAFSGTPTAGALANISSDEFFAIQQVIPAHVVLPITLLPAFVILVVICTLALAIMARVALRPSMSQTLRLNED
jgi:putative ABC transport system permease protein